jgi:hypothetical protein
MSKLRRCGLPYGRKASVSSLSFAHEVSEASCYMTKAKTSPKITRLSWGVLNVEGYENSFKDAKLYPGGAREWDWTETGTRHDPGIQPADVEELLTHGATVVVLSKGINRRLQIMPETRQWLEDRGVGLYVLQTEEAVQRYNELREDKAVGALIHSTC